MSYHCFSMTLQRAKRQHSCIWCGRTILLGSHYKREKSVYDGHHQNFAWHEACRADADEWFGEHGEDDFFPGDHDMPYRALCEVDRAALPSGEQP